MLLHSQGRSGCLCLISGRTRESICYEFVFCFQSSDQERDGISCNWKCNEMDKSSFWGFIDRMIWVLRLGWNVRGGFTHSTEDMTLVYSSNECVLMIVWLMKEVYLGSFSVNLIGTHVSSNHIRMFLSLKLLYFTSRYQSN